LGYVRFTPKRTFDRDLPNVRFAPKAVIQYASRYNAGAQVVRCFFEGAPAANFEALEPKKQRMTVKRAVLAF